MANKLPSVKEDKNIGETEEFAGSLELKLLVAIAEQQHDKEIAKRGLDYSVCFHLNSNQSFTVAIYHREFAVLFSVEIERNQCSVKCSQKRLNLTLLCPD